MRKGLLGSVAAWQPARACGVARGRSQPAGARRFVAMGNFPTPTDADRRRPTRKKKLGNGNTPIA
jgi:hypothetical protein